MKRLFTLALALAMIFSIFSTISLTASAASGTGFTDAIYLNDEISISGKTTDGYRNDTDYYRFFTPKSGNVNITFTYQQQGNTKACWDITVYNSSYTEIENFQAFGNKSSAQSVSLGLPSGMYYITVASTDYYDGRMGKYNIKYSFNASTLWEKEINNSFLEANTIRTNTTYSGVTNESYREEYDYYKFTISKQGYVYINFKTPLQSDSDVWWEVELYNNAYEKMLTQKIYGNKSNTDTAKIGLAAGIYYIKVYSPDYYDYSDDVYRLKACYAPSSYWETENNDEPTTADKININTDYNGTTVANNNYNYDYDYYKVQIDKTGTYNLKFTTKKIDSTSETWQVRILDSEYNEKKLVRVYGNIGTYNVQTFLQKGTYYIMVSSISTKQYCTNPYTINLSTYVANATGLKYTATTNSITLKWNKAFGATGYLVERYSTKSKKYVSIGTSADTTYTNKGLLVGTSYTYRIRPYATINGKKVYSNNYTVIKATSSKYKPKSITASKTVYTYSGKANKPTITVKNASNIKLKEGTHYTVKYFSDTKNVGKHKVTVTMKGNYTGSKTFYITVKPTPTGISNAIAIKKGITVYMAKKTTQVSGYQIQYSKDSGFKSAAIKTISGAKNNAGTVKNLASNQKYYVRVRTYKTVNGVNYYSNWSKTKYAITK